MYRDPFRRLDIDATSVMTNRTARLFKNIRNKAVPTEVEEWADDDIIIVAFGNSGAGKTTFVNAAANANLPVNSGLDPCTTEVTYARMTLPELTERKIVLIDTPGLDTQADAYARNVGAFLKKHYVRKVAPSGILYFQDLTSTSDLSIGRNLWSSMENFGAKSSWPRMRLVTTGWANLSAEEIKSKEESVLYQFLAMAVSPDLKASRFDQTRDSAIQILLPFIGFAKNRAACLLLEEISQGGKPEFASLKELAGLLEQQRILLNKLCHEREDIAPGSDARRALLDELGENGKAVKAKATAMKPARESSRSRSIVQAIGSWLWPVSPSERLQASNEMDKLHKILESAKTVTPDSKVFLLLGTVGSGKSQFIQDCIGSRHMLKVSDVLISNQAEPVQMFQGTVGESDVVFIDTPGFNQPDTISDAAIVTEVTSWLVVMKNLNSKFRDFDSVVV